VGPESVKPVPLTAAESTVTDEVPVEVKITVCVAGISRTTFPNPMLVALMLSAGPDNTFNCRMKVSETVPALAFSVTACAVATADAVAVNVALVALAATATEAGTVTALLLLDKLTGNPPLLAAVLSVTVQESVPEPVREALAHESAVKDAVAGADAPVPLRATTTVPSVEAALVAMICPVAAPATAGLNCTSRS
jgi:hypothetical protein